MGGKTANQLRRSARRFGGVRSWQLILILIPLLFVTATLLRLDHLRMVELRDTVLEADAAEDDATLAESLTALRQFVFTHVVVNVVESNGIQSITFGTGPFYLEHQYLRAANAILEEIESRPVDDSNPNGNIYAAVSAICRPLAIANGWAWNNPNYLECWTSELNKYPAGEELTTSFTAELPSTEEFRYNYASPVWAPTWAGFAMLACLIIILIVVIRFLVWCVLGIALIFAEKA